MELIDRTRSKASAEVHDVISSMPENAVTNILDSLPIRDVARTGILSKTWRFKWTMLTQIVFDFEKYYDERDLSIFLLQLKGPLTKFVLHIPNYKVLDVKDINHWIMFLSRKGIKEFTLINNHRTQLKLPSHLFSCLELKHLKLRNCCFRLPATFCGFPNLLSLDLFCVTFESDNCGQLITRCPLLEILKVSYHHDPSQKLKLVEIANLKNLKVLSLPLCNLDYTATALSIICQLSSYFRKLQEHNLDFHNSKFPQEFDNSEYMGINNIFPSLRSLTLSQVDFCSSAVLSSAFETIWGCQNLQTLEMEVTYIDLDAPPLYGSLEENSSKIRQLQLRSVVLASFRGSEIEIYLIKCILACSPLLKKMVIYINSSLVFGGENGKLMFATELLKCYRVSTIAQVELHWS